ncbi:transcriptional activator, adenine-specific DNA methyltransferase [Vibrio phage VpaJT_1]|nr:transcriptional activator, adenine-specific DNA methyltransferase [Vibrio phage VpaJT_1]
MKIDLYNPPVAFDLIVADPPWAYGSRGARSGRHAELDYPTMTVAEICALPVAQAAAETSILQLWFTGAFGEQAYQVCRAWGFEPVRIDRVWAKRTVNDKPHAVTGPWGMTDCEFILLGTRGKANSTLLTSRSGYTLKHEQYPGRHSRKPSEFYDEMEERFGNCQWRLEIFARETRDGWCRWGNEA